jgi:competence transcription factor ComK
MNILFEFYGQTVTVDCYVDNYNQVDYEYEETLFTDEQVIEIDKKLNSLNSEIRETIKKRNMLGIDC